MAETELRKIRTTDRNDIPAPRRVETGPVQFNDDWPGLFIRGDDCRRMLFGMRTLLNLLASADLLSVDAADEEDG